MRTEHAPVLLELDRIEVRYGTIAAVRGASLSVREGELVSLIGANGAGKSTTLNAIAGLLPLAAGAVRYCAQTLPDEPADRRLRRGIALVPEGRGILARLSVAENLRLGAYTRPQDASLQADYERLYTLMPRLRERLQQQAGTLSGGEQQMLALGRALLARPRLLLLDEPSMGLAPRLVDRVYDTIAQIAADGVSILLVEQNAALALDMAQRAYVMAAGEIVLEGAAAALREDPAVRRAYLGA
jgi:branched-chain amino acid transport system ATP-binding protein